ncbi:MAG: ubiquinol-cytochrome c reductase iron-sulfur subunit [Polyangiaceae bacterium]
MGSSDGSDERREGRRDALRVLVVAGGAAFGCALAAPAAYFVTAPMAEVNGPAGSGTWVRTIPLASLTEGQPKKVAIVADQKDAWTIAKNVELGAVWLVRKGDAVQALAVVCPHLGCSVNAEADGTFICPCHTSTFAADGKKIAGPSPRDMDALTTKIQDEFVYVQFARFRTGTPNRIRMGA